MIALAFDTATDRCTAALSDGVRVAHRVIDGSRRHAGEILVLLDQLLAEAGAGPRDVSLLVTGDGPGSFTGLRVATAVAKALVWQRDVVWRTAPSLLVRAAAHVPDGGGTVMAVSDALRGELYAGCWRWSADGQPTIVGGAPRAMRPAGLAAFGPVDRVVGAVPAPLVAEVASVTGRSLIGGEAALPDARRLLALADHPGATTLVTDPAGWEPAYGRPAEAQALWEQRHGQQLPPSTSVIG